VGRRGDGGHTVGRQEGIRVRVRAAGKALEGDDRQTMTDSQILCPLYDDHLPKCKHQG